MKGLLLKDYYLVNKYFRVYYLVIVIFIAISLFSNSSFIIFYPALLISMVGINTLSIDEKNRWLLYSATMPYQPKDIVASKYLITIIFLSILLILQISVQWISMIIKGSYNGQLLANTLYLFLICGLFIPCFVYPFSFKFGAERGRIYYLVSIGLLFSIICLLTMSVDIGSINTGIVNTDFPLAVIPVILIPLTYLSYRLSVRLYQQREI